MNVKRLGAMLIVMGILSTLLGLFSGCTDRTADPSDEITPIALPEEASLKHLFITHQGMRGGSYYILKTTDEGTYLKISDTSPDYLRMLDGEDGDTVKYLAYADTVKDCERASLVLLEDDAPLRELEDAIAEAGALGWDGFSKSVAMPNVKDSGDRYELYLELSDGTTVTVDGYNAKPAGFLELLRRAEEIFRANSDLS